MPKNSLDSLETVLTGEAEKLLRQHNATMLAKYGNIRPELEALYATIQKSRVSDVLKVAKKQLDPLSDRFDPTAKAGLDDLSLFKFINSVGGSLLGYITQCNKRLELISTACEMLFPALDQDADLSSIMLAEESGHQLMVMAEQEYYNTVQEFERLLAGIYLGTRNEYKKLRKKFLGGSASLLEDDNVEDQLMLSFFGMKPPKKESSGPVVALIDDNCILTQLFLDISVNLPRYSEKITPILKRGKVTGKTTTTKILDTGEVEDWAATLMSVAHPTYWKYINVPQDLTKTILTTLQAFQLEYVAVARALTALAQKANFRNIDDDNKHVIEDPNALVKQYNRINFLSIRPSAEDIAPRTKVDSDMAIARTKLFLHLQATLMSLTDMDRYAQDTEDFAVLKIREAIDLKRAMDDIEKTEEQKNLQRNIQDDNEFYCGKSGMHGQLLVEREPAPKIKYEDVVGSSFVKCKQHVEEVVKVASHPHIMRLSAPRGNVKSNLMLIGPYGCGKSEIAKAIGGDKRIIGFNVAVADLLTAFMHESVKNIKRLWDHAKDLRRKSRYTKPVGILMDEFDRLFDYGEGVHAAYDGGRMTGILQEMMDGIVGYEGVFMVGLTNVPKAIPDAIMRRFKYVDVVGQLTQEERAHLLKQFLTKGLPIAPEVTEADFMKWAEMLNNAPGDVLGKVADEIHFKFMHELVNGEAAKMLLIEKTLSKRLRDREVAKRDYDYIKKSLGAHKIISPSDITTALETTIAQPQVKMQINKAKQVYRDAEEIMRGLADVNDGGMGFDGKRRVVWGS